MVLTQDNAQQSGFFARLGTRCEEIDSLLCVGLDPHPDELPEWTPRAMYDFCLRLVDTTAEYAAAFKPNSAFFEALGAPGIETLQAVIKAIPNEIPVILDAKRGDIASTARAYAQAVFEVLGASAVTASPYLGWDSLEPFLGYPGRGVFLLCKTSNPGANDLQDLVLQEEPGLGVSRRVFEAVAHKVVAWNQRLPEKNLALVVGATQPDALARVREIAPDAWILAPGIGAQGGDLSAAVSAGIRQDGLGLLLPVSRQVSRAADPRQEADKIRQEINKHRRSFIAAQSVIKKTAPAPELDAVSAQKENLAQVLLDTGCVKFGSFTLKSGLESPIYIDLRILASFPEALALAARGCIPALENLVFDRIAALPYAAIPIGTAVSLERGWSLIYPRKETKEYGTRRDVEGVFVPGEQVVVLDDLTTTGGSKFEAIEKLKSAGLIIRDVVVLIDRQSGADQALHDQGYRLHAVFTLTELLNIWERNGSVGLTKLTPRVLFCAAPKFVSIPGANRVASQG